jgi:hypothetical protein
MNLHFSEEKPSRADVQLDALQQARAGGERAQRETDERNILALRADPRLMRICRAYFLADEAERAALALAAEGVRG